MAVIGMGKIGSEIVQAISRLGITITGFGHNERIAGPPMRVQYLESIRVEYQHEKLLRQTIPSRF